MVILKGKRIAQLKGVKQETFIYLFSNSKIFATMSLLIY